MSIERMGFQLVEKIENELYEYVSVPKFNALVGPLLIPLDIYLVRYHTYCI